MYFLESYGYFLLCSVTIVIAVLAAIAGVMALSAKAKQKAKGYLSVENLSDAFDEQQQTLHTQLLSKDERKALKKQHKKATKSKAKPRLFVIDFNGDMMASSAESLCKCVNAIMLSAQKNDRVLISIESPGGVVPGYGLCASQIQRLRDAGFSVTVAIDKVAASGGYMMACVANEIIAAPFAIIGSIGVVAQLPNFNRWLKDKHIDFEQLTAGEFKRTLTMFGENTQADREKMQQDIDATHELFKQHVSSHRPQLDINQVATGEHWYGQQALALGLIDSVQTRDQYLIDQNKHYTLYQIAYKMKPNLSKRIGIGAASLLLRIRYACSRQTTA